MPKATGSFRLLQGHFAPFLLQLITFVLVIQISLDRFISDYKDNNL